MSVGDDQLDAGQTAGDQRTQEGKPAGAVLAGGDVDAEDLPVSVGVTPTAISAWTLMMRPPPRTFWSAHRRDPDERIRAGVQRPVAEGCNLLVQVPGHRRDLRLGQLSDAERLGELLDTAGGDAEEVGSGHHRDEGLLSPAAALQEPVREVTPAAQLGNGQFNGARPRVPLARAISVAVVDSLVADLPVFGIAEGTRSQSGRRRLAPGLWGLPEEAERAAQPAVPTEGSPF